MGPSRLPRFLRDSKIPRIELTPRDREIVRLIHRHRFLSSVQIIALIGHSPQHLLRRLQWLYHHGFLERPRAQIDYYRQGGSRPIVYALGNMGKAVLPEEQGEAKRKLRWDQKNRTVGRLFFEHALLVSDIMVKLELACRNRSDVFLRASDDHQVSGDTGRPYPSKWRIQVNQRLTLGIVPDRVFALDVNDENGRLNRAFFFLEADRGTMPVVRKNLSQCSIQRKLLAYEATWATGLHRSKLGFHRFRVLTVTTSAARVKSLVVACSQLKRGHGLFLFCDQATLNEHGDILSVPWQTGRGEMTTLLA